MYRLILLALAAVVAAGALAQGAAAEKPIKEPAPSATLSLPPGLVCSFGVEGVPAANRSSEHRFSSGKILLTGFFSATLTNASNGNSITVQSNGPITNTPEGANLRLVSSGPVIWFFFPGDAGPGDDSIGRAYLIRGHVSILADHSFTFLEFDSTGTLTDLCAAIA